MKFSEKEFANSLVVIETMYFSYSFSISFFIVNFALVFVEVLHNSYQ